MYLPVAINHRSLLLSGMKAVADMKISSEFAIYARETALSILEKSESDSLFYSATFKSFAEELICQLSAYTSKESTDMEVKLGAYHEYRTSNVFHELWRQFIQKATSGKTAHPTFYQHVTQYVFNSLLKLRYPATRGATEDHAVETLSREEENALRYVCGYVIRKVGIALNQESDNCEIDDCLRCLYGDEMVDKGTEDWTNAVDRGGLWHINDEAYTFFYSIELHVRKAFAKGISESNLKSSCYILEDETVEFHWSQLTSDIDETISKKY